MYRDILSDSQKELFPFLKQFGKDFCLVGGTAIALQIGHRRSIDFDMFRSQAFHSLKIKRKIAESGFTNQIIHEESDQIHFLVNGVKLTFFSFGFEIHPVIRLDNIIKMPDLLELSAMKAFAIGRRAKWKDYVDMYFILKYHYSLSTIVSKSNELFKNVFSEKLLRQQLCYFDDMDFSEEVEFMPGFEVKKEEVMNFLIHCSTEPLR